MPAKKDRQLKNSKKRSRRRSESKAGGFDYKKLVAQVWELAEPLCTGEGVELVHIEHQREAAGRILRLYIDKPNGITLDDCVYISRQLNDLLDVGLDIDLPYNLEVSSPGPERPLGREKDFERFKGQVVKIKTSQPINGQRNFKGILEGLSEGYIKILINGQPTNIPYPLVDKARLTPTDGVK